jgi:serine/threonine protein kinase
MAAEQSDSDGDEEDEEDETAGSGRSAGQGDAAAAEDDYEDEPSYETVMPWQGNGERVGVAQPTSLVHPQLEGDARIKALETRLLSSASIILHKSSVGSGRSGQLQRCVWSGTEAVMKMGRDNNGHSVLHEALCLLRLQHPRIVALYGVVADSLPPRLVLQYAERGSLEATLQKEGAKEWTPRRRLQACMQIAEGVAYLHSQQVVHADLAARNVLLSEKGDCLLCDFDLSIWQGMQQPINEEGVRHMAVRWAAPEIFLTKSAYTPASDIWALGVTMWEVYSNCKVGGGGMCGGQEKDP